MSDILLENMLRMLPEVSGMNADSLIFMQSVSFCQENS